MKDTSSDTLLVLKLFLMEETKEFAKEVERNLRLLDSPMLFKCTAYEFARPNMPLLVINNISYSSYNYLILPYCKNGTLIDLLLKA